MIRRQPEPPRRHAWAASLLAPTPHGVRGYHPISWSEKTRPRSVHVGSGPAGGNGLCQGVCLALSDLGGPWATDAVAELPHWSEPLIGKSDLEAGPSLGRCSVTRACHSQAGATP